MAKFVIATFALIAMIGSVAADPLLGLLGNNGQGQGAAGLTSGLGGGLLAEVTSGLLASVHRLTESAADRTIKRESDRARQFASDAASQAVIQKHAQGETPEAAKEAARLAILTVIAPLVEMLATETAVAAVNAVYFNQTPGQTQGQGGLGGK